MTNSTQLSLLTEDELASLERRIREGLRSFVEVGEALLTIQQKEGYRLRGYKTFEAYCEKEYGFGDRQGRRLISAAQTANKVQVIAGQAPSSESVARVLAPVADKPELVQKVVKKLETRRTDIARATADQVAEAVATVTGKTRPEPKPANGNGHKPEAPKAFTPPASVEVPYATAMELREHLSTINLYVDRQDMNGDEPVVEAITRAVTIVNILVGDKPAKACKTCNKPLQPGARMCAHCGEVVK